MPQILIDGQLQDVSQEEFDAWTAANPGPGEVPAGGEILQVPNQPQILEPNTVNTSPDQILPEIIESVNTDPSSISSADYYGEELFYEPVPVTVQPADNIYGSQLTKADDLVAQDKSAVINTNLDPSAVVPLVKSLDLMARDSNVSIYTDLDPAIPLTKNIADRVYTDTPSPIDAPQLYGGGLTTEPVRNLAPKTGDTLSAGGSAALIGAATLGAYAYKALSPSGLKDYYSAADEADRLAINPNAAAPISQANFSEYGYPNIGDVPPENYDAISLDNPYQDGPGGALDLNTGEINYGDEVSLDNPYQDQDGDGVIDLETGEELTSGFDDIYVDGADGAVDFATSEVNYGDDLSLDNPYQDEEGGAVDLATGDVNFGQELDLNTPYEEQANFTEFTDTGSVEWTPEDAAGIDSPYEDQTGVTEFTADDEVQWTEEDASGLDSPYEDQGDGALDLGTGEINYGDDLSLDTPYQDQGDGALDLDTGEINYGDDLSLDNPYQDTEGAQDLETGEFFTDSDAASRAAAEQQAAKVNAQAQAAVQAQRNQASQGDWRVKLRLAGGANYLYKAPDAQTGILQPLAATDGVIFPYMPQIQTSYQANYNNYDLTHSNYRGYFYQSSHVGEINITAPFTAQDTSEANYLLAVIHFFRSATKMFYGQDSVGRGSPPPLVYLQGLGEFQFNLHPCVISQFTYNLPNDVDYIRARSVFPGNGTNMLVRRDRQTTATNPIASAINRLQNAGLPKGGLNIPPAPQTLGQKSPTYVPTKMEIQLTLLPIQSRSQVSKEFSMQKFSNGNLLKGGFW